MLNANPLAILSLVGAIGAVNTPSTPVTIGETGRGAFRRGVGSGSEQTSSTKRSVLHVARSSATGGAVAGTISIWGVDLPDPLAGKPLGNAFAAPLSETVQAFQALPNTDGSASALVGQPQLDTILPFVTFANYNWIVVKNGVIVPRVAGVTGYSITNNGGFARVVMGTNIAASDDYAVYFTVPVQVMADGPHPIEKVGVRGYVVMWVLFGAADQAAGDVTLVTLDPIIGV